MNDPWIVIVGDPGRKTMHFGPFAGVDVAHDWGKQNAAEAWEIIHTITCDERDKRRNDFKCFFVHAPEDLHGELSTPTGRLMQVNAGLLSLLSQCLNANDTILTDLQTLANMCDSEHAAEVIKHAAEEVGKVIHAIKSATVPVEGGVA